MMNPSPNAAPMSPKFLARSSIGETSAMYAWAVETLPPVKPSISRARKSSQSVCAAPKRK